MSLLAARRSPVQARSLAWAGYAASAWAIAYAVLVRGRTGGSASMERRLVVATVVAALALTAFSCSLVVARSA